MSLYILIFRNQKERNAIIRSTNYVSMTCVEQLKLTQLLSVLNIKELNKLGKYLYVTE